MHFLHTLIPVLPKMSPLILTSLALINVFAFLLYSWDKRAAQSGRRRVPEARLLTIAFLGGSAGAMIACHLFRHKTSKQPFRRYLLMIAWLHIVLGLALVFVLFPDTIGIFPS